jgi:hypothetical protein
MEESNPLTKAGIGLRLFVGFGVLVGFVRICIGRPQELEGFSPALEPDEEYGVDECDGDPPPAPSEKKHFLDEAETWKRAKFLFPGLLSPEAIYTKTHLHRSVE